jgi:hypothetical protein
VPRDEHIFHVCFQIQGATEPDAYAIRAYEDDGLQDILFGGPSSAGVFEVDFRRTAARFEDAVLSAIDDLCRVFPEARMLEVKPGYLATLADISARIGHSHKFLRLLVRGKRGPGGFPRPAGGRRGRPKTWRWNEVEPWFADKLHIQVPKRRHAAFLATVNDVLQVQRVAPQGTRGSEDVRRLTALLSSEQTTS